jgi:chemosensory pili system protein ChpA (sensor histidine kinase/response regulator)
MGYYIKLRRILCLDDEPTLIAEFKYILEAAGYEVLTTTSTTEAMRILRTEPVDLLIQDLMRPDISGFSLYAFLKADARLQHVPVVICSGHPESRRKFRARYPEVSVVFGKPFKIDSLLDAVKKAIP